MSHGMTFLLVLLVVEIRMTATQMSSIIVKHSQV
jgi:hypothetical protein